MLEMRKKPQLNGEVIVEAAQIMKDLGSKHTLS